MAYDELTARLAKQASQLEQALAEKDLEIAKWKARSWDDNVQFIAESKEHLLREYIRLTELYGEQKHEIRKLKALAGRFATALYDPNVQVMGDPLYMEAQAFLKERQS